MTRPRRLVFTWNSPYAAGTRVAVELEPLSARSTRVQLWRHQLRHEGNGEPPRWMGLHLVRPGTPRRGGEKRPCPLMSYRRSSSNAPWKTSQNTARIRIMRRNGTGPSSVNGRHLDGCAVGSRIAFEASFLGRRLAYVYEIAERAPGHRLVMRTRQGPFPMETTYTWEATGSGKTPMTLRNRGEPGGFSALMVPVMAPAMRHADPPGPSPAESTARGAVREEHYSSLCTVYGRTQARTPRRSVRLPLECVARPFALSHLDSLAGPDIRFTFLSLHVGGHPRRSNFIDSGVCRARSSPGCS